MPLAVGSRIGPYQITALIGAGGMGEVYRATDTRLGRDVAIKSLPADLASDADRLARFRREAQVLAQLNHPNIAAIHGLEEAAGTPLLVLELVEGEDLAARLQRGPLPIDEAIVIARHITEGLEEAHEKGIVHRDLKPANVEVTPDGKVKILDFGLAKAFTSAEAGSDGGGADLSRSPTLKQTAGLAHSGTRAGVILGTAAYMAPEQARGRAVDRRADIWAFGVVFWEMLTGRPLFGGETLSDVLAAVLTRDPDWSALPQDTPPHLVRLLRRCLERDPRRRLQAIGEARVALEQSGVEAMAILSSPHGDSDPPPGASRRWLAAVAFLAAAIGAGVMYALGLTGGAAAPAPEAITFPLDPPAGSHYLYGIALSRDGRSLAFTATDAAGHAALWLRPLDSLEPRRLDGTDGARFPFWSPDGRQIGFFANSQLKVVDLVVGAVRTLVRTGSAPRGGAWGNDDAILYSPAATTPLFKISAQGGTPSPATALDAARKDGTHRWPSFLPDGRHFLFYASLGSGTEPGILCLGSLDSLATRTLTAAQSSGVFLPPHTVVFTLGKTLVGQEFDLDRQTLSGSAVPLGVELPGSLGVSGFRYLSAAAPGTLVYRQAPGQTSRLVWADRSGRELGSVVEDDDWHNQPQIAPDGRRVVVSHYAPQAGQGDIVVHDTERHLDSRVTYDDRDDNNAVWSTDGKLLALTTITPTSSVISVIDPSHPESRRHLLDTPAGGSLFGWFPDGGLLITLTGQDERPDIYRLPPGSDKPVPIVNTPFSEDEPSVTGDGQWLAYVGDSTGRDEIYVRSMATGEEWRVSKEGGKSPVWRRNGRELFYRDDRGFIMVVPVGASNHPSFGEPRALFQGQLDMSGGQQYDVTPDGQRFVLNRRSEIAENPIVVRLGAGQAFAGRRAP